MVQITSMKRESALTFAGILINASLAFVTTWMIANRLGAAATGDFFLFVSVFTITAGIVGMGADTGLVRALSEAQARDRIGDVWPTLRVAVGPIVATGCALALLVLLLAGPIAAALGAEHHGASTVRVLALALLPGAMIGVLLGASRGLGHVLTYTAIQNLFVPIARVGAVAVAVYVIGSERLVVWAWSLPLVVAACAALALLWRQVGSIDARSPTVRQTDLREVRGPFWRFALPRGGSIVIERVLDWADVLIVVAVLGAAAGGTYGVITRVVAAGAMFEGALRIVMGPRLSAANAVGDHAGAERMFQHFTVALILLLWPYYIFIAIYAKDILGLFGEEFVAGSSALIVLAITMALGNTMGPLQTVLLMTGRSMWQLSNKAVQVVVLVGASLIFIPWLGIFGAAMAYALGVITDTALATFQVTRRLHFQSDARSIVRAASFPLLGVFATGLMLAWLLADSSTLLRLTTMSLVVAAYSAGIAMLVRKRTSLFGTSARRVDAAADGPAPIVSGGGLRTRSGEPGEVSNPNRLHRPQDAKCATRPR